MPRLARRGLSLAITGIVLASLLLISRDAGAGPPVQGQILVEGAVQSTPVLQYQGRLLDPATGNSKPDGSYHMIFSLYDVPAGGTALWSETRDVAVARGLFSTFLGEATPLDPSDFDGRALWLGVTVGADPETTPRQPIAYVAYALHAKDAETVDGQQASAFAAASHAHSGADITSGVVAETRIAGEIARDGEVTDAVNLHASDPDVHHPRYTDDEAWTAVLDRSGPGSGLDADLLDGQHAGDFAIAGHTHSTADITAGTLSTDRFSAYDDLVTEGKIGAGSGQVAAGDHAHDGRYYTQAAADTRYVNAAGDTMSGSLAVPRVTYTTPRTHYFVVGSEGFVPGSNVDYWNTYGNGGAYIASGSGALVAPVHLPQGAVVTEFKVFFYDNSGGDMSVYLQKQSMQGGGYAHMAQVSSAGVLEYDSRTDISISSATIDNTTYSYLVYAYSAAWDSNLKIKGALVTYTIDEAP